MPSPIVDFAMVSASKEYPDEADLRNFGFIVSKYLEARSFQDGPVGPRFPQGVAL